MASYPDLSLAEARGIHDEARNLVANGRDPAQEKRVAKAIAKIKTANTFGAADEEWKTELIEAVWSEIDFEADQWIIPAARMKTRQEHVVPLCRQAVEALRLLRPLSCESTDLFPSNSSKEKPMRRSTINVMFDRVRYAGRFTPHGFRATASTQLNELGFRADVIERQLAHAERDVIRAAYNHAQYLAERRAMMQAWGDWLDELLRAAHGNGLLTIRDNAIQSRPSNG